MCMFYLLYFYTFLMLIISVTFLIQNFGLKLHNQAPKCANFYESQWIALKLKNIRKLTKKSHAVSITGSESGRIYA